ncbi:GH25 family lysozyme [Nocardia sp. NPDC046763]|uniref:GH25 family lysozyme n=1 Tax=Nocardia sp. NPDC046763 TaxID=3155256 RepID=UPI0033F753DE
MTLYGVDISNWQAGISIPEIAAAGFSWVEAKVSEGDYLQDPTWPEFLASAREIGLPIIGYHYAMADCAPAAQVRTWLANNGGANAMIDFEGGGGDIGDFWALVQAFDDAGVNVALSYLPQWYWEQIGSPDLSQVPGLVASAYPGGSGYASDIYAAAGGDSGQGWTPYGHAQPLIWQFSDQASVAGMSLDANAFRGDIDSLTALIGDDMTPQQAQQLQDIWDQLRGPNGQGWPQLGHNGKGQNLTPVDALAGLIATVNGLIADVQALKGATNP